VSFTADFIILDAGVVVTQAYALVPGNVTATSTVSLPGPAAVAAMILELAAAGRAGITAAAVEKAQRLLAATPASTASAASGASASAGRDASSASGAAANASLGLSGSSFTRYGVTFPAFMFDGQSNTTVTVPGAGDNGPVCVAGPAASGWATQCLSVAVPGGHSVTYTWNGSPSAQYYVRNGLAATVYADVTCCETDTPSLTYTVAASVQQ
jgi:hypothetical protein